MKEENQVKLIWKIEGKRQGGKPHKGWMENMSDMTQEDLKDEYAQGRIL